MDETLNINGHYYTDWLDFFHKSFERSGKFQKVDKREKGDILIEQYIPLDKNNKTIITVDYDKFGETLIALTYYNPQTAGYSKMQEFEFFYRDHFADPPDYNGVGLEFIELNLKAIDKQLRDGIKGKEEQFFKNGKHLKSKIYLAYHEKLSDIGWTVYLEKRSLFQRIVNLFSKKDTDFTIKTIDLNSIFPGL